METYLQLLKTVTLFEGIDESDLQSILSCLSAKTVHFEKKQFINLNSHSSTNVGIVLCGEVQIVKEDYYGNRCIVAKISAGNLFGETFACADVKTPPVTIFAATEADILFINYHRLITPCTKACTFHSTLIYNMLRIVAMKNIVLNQKIEFTSKRTTREKLLSYLSAEAQKSNSNSFIIPFNRQELADYLSVDRSAMSAELSKMRDDGILRFNRSSFELQLPTFLSS